MAKCNQCGKSYKTAEAMAQHVKAKHAGASSSGSGKKKASGTMGYKAGAYNPFMGGGAGRKNLLRQDVEAKLGASQTGGAWARRALHPCDEEQGGGERIPDLTTNDSVAPEFRNRYTVSAPSGLSATDTWEMALLVLPVPEAPVITMTRKSNTDVWGNITVWSFPVLKPGAFSLGGPKSGDLGIYGDEHRTTFKGISGRFNAASLSNQGVVYGAQWPQEPVYSDETYTVKIDEKDTEILQRNLQFFGIPLSVNEMFQKTARATQWLARDGFYLPMQFRQPTHNYVGGSTQSGHALQFGGNPASPSSAKFQINNAGNTELTSLTKPELAQVALGFSAATNDGVGLIICEGMAITSSWDIKCRQGFEIVPTNTSPWSPFIETGPYYDREALESVQVISKQMQLVYPAAYNDWGLLLSKVLVPLAKMGVRTFGPAIASWVNNWVNKRD